MKRLMFLPLLALAGCMQQPHVTDFKSTVCNSDGTVTFYYKNDNAKDVKVDVQFAGRNDMKKDSVTGLWTATLGPAAADMYPYCYVVDGVSIMDPECAAYFPNEGFKNSLLEISDSSKNLPHDIRDVKHGKIEYVNYYSENLGAVNHAVVYLPPSYFDGTDKKYPVFYLISGTTDTEEVYSKVGRANYIADNLVADNKAEEMIIVMPYGNPYKLLPVMPDAASVPQTNFDKDIFSLDFTNDLMPYIESHYRTINDKDHRAIGGFSRGGNQGLSVGLHNLDKFSYLCSYSSFTSTEIKDVYDNAESTNSQIKLFWLGVGTDDFLYGNARDYTEFLDKKGIRCVKEYTSDKFGHTWMNAKYFLNISMQLLFKPEAAENAMSNAKPTLAATGNEKQFTPGVMARLFPKPLISPEYTENSIIFRFKAPESQKVELVTEKQRFEMQKDTAGIWSVTLNNNIFEPFTYHFEFDGTPTADPQNMYITTSKKFKESISRHPNCSYNYVSTGKINYGQVSYDFNNNTVTYSPTENCEESVLLVPTTTDAVDSWFVIGAANIVADKLISEGKIKPCKLTTDSSVKVCATIKASDFSTWSERQKALENLLISKFGK
jgi:enterochelin esterase-like enzyme